MHSHPEAMSAPSERACWALIHKGTNGAAFVVASSAAISSDILDIGSAEVKELGLPIPDHTGFWLWSGIAWFDGLDGTGYYSEKPLELLSYRGAALRMGEHEEPYAETPVGADASL